MTLMLDNRQQKYDEEKAFGLIDMAIKTCLEHEGIVKACEVSVTLVDNDEIKEINREYRNIDNPTDVLSFPMFERDELKDIRWDDVDSLDMDTGEVVLGDIVISLERAEEQSKEYGHSFDREVAFLTVHGMLHLLGYDHEEEEDRKAMRLREEQILNGLGLNR